MIYKLLKKIVGHDIQSMFASMSMDTNDVQLLQDLMTDAPTSNASATGFSAQWSKMFGDSQAPASTPSSNNENLLLGQLGEPKKPSIENDDDEFTNFVSGNDHQGAAAMSSVDLMGLDNQQSSHGQAFLPSQLFDLDQSLYSKQSTSNTLTDLLNLGKN